MQDDAALVKKLIARYSQKGDDGEIRACERIVDDLWSRYQVGRSAKTIYYISIGHQPAGERLKAALDKLWDWKMRPKKKTVTIRYEPDDPRRARALSLDMEQRRKALEEYHE